MASGVISALARTGAAALLGIAGWSFWLLLREEATPPPGFATAQVGSARLRFDPAYTRAGEAGDRGHLGELDIAARFPSLAPAGADYNAKPETLLFLRIEPAGDSLAPEERMGRLYARFLEAYLWTHPGGLIMRRFEPGSPFEREDLYYAPPEGRVFMARCTRPAQPPDGLPETCIHDIRVTGLDIHVRFAPELLRDWEQVSSGARALIARIAR